MNRLTTVLGHVQPEASLTFCSNDLVPHTYDGELKDPFGYELSKNTVLHNNMPIVAEVPGKVLIQDWRTKNKNFYMRHHFPVPDLTPDDYRLRIHGLGLDNDVVLTLADLKKFEKVSIDATLMCTGNRRSEMIREAPKTTGLPWKVGGLSNAKWSGCRLADVLRSIGFRMGEDPRVKYVRFEGYDHGQRASQRFGSSIHISQVLPYFDVILAWEMNDVEIPKIHGYPIRVVIPGCTAARSVKWLERIELADSHYDGHYQRVAYKMWTPRIDSWKGIDMRKVPPIHYLPVQAACCTLDDGDIVTGDSFDCRGYALSGGGRTIVRVDVSIDDGETWQTADLIPNGQEEGKAWAWTFWRAHIKLFKRQTPLKIPFQLIVKATDSHHNSMPDTCKGLINPRGYLNNQWHRTNLLRM